MKLKNEEEKEEKEEEDHDDDDDESSGVERPKLFITGFEPRAML